MVLTKNTAITCELEQIFPMIAKPYRKGPNRLENSLLSSALKTEPFLPSFPVKHKKHKRAYQSEKCRRLFISLRHINSKNKTRQRKVNEETIHKINPHVTDEVSLSRFS